jgi:hypothetical protein
MAQTGIGLCFVGFLRLFKKLNGIEIAMRTATSAGPASKDDLKDYRVDVTDLLAAFRVIAQHLRSGQNGIRKETRLKSTKNASEIRPGCEKDLLPCFRGGAVQISYIPQVTLCERSELYVFLKQLLNIVRFLK